MSTDRLRGHASVQVHADTDKEEDEEEILAEVSSDTEEPTEESNVPDSTSLLGQHRKSATVRRNFVQRANVGSPANHIAIGSLLG